MTLHSPLHADIAALLPRLRRLARAITLDRDDADDLVQVAIERAMNRSMEWHRGVRPDLWLFGIVVGAWTEEVRARGRREQSAEASAGATPDVQLRKAIEQAVSLLPEEQRLVAALVLVEGLPYKEAAAVLEIPVGTLTGRLARARQALQGLLSDQARNLA